MSVTVRAEYLTINEANLRLLNIGNHNFQGNSRDFLYMGNKDIVFSIDVRIFKPRDVKTIVHYIAFSLYIISQWFFDHNFFILIC